MSTNEKTIGNNPKTMNSNRNGLISTYGAAEGFNFRRING
jgi:hypothetical protein